MFYISCNSLAVTPYMSKKAALAMWENARDFDIDPESNYQLCKAPKTPYGFNPVMDLN